MIQRDAFGLSDHDDGWSERETGTHEMGSRITAVAGGVVVELRGELSRATGPALLEALVRAAVAAEPRERVVVDLAEVTSVDADAVDELARLHRVVQLSGGSLAVCHAPRAWRELSGSTRLEAVGEAPADEQLNGTWWRRMLDEQVVIHQSAGILAQRLMLTPVAALDLMSSRAHREQVSIGTVAQGVADGTMTPSSLRALRVLYIEDNNLNLRLMRGVMRSRPNHVLEAATTGAAGLAAARRLVPDVVILDLDLPDMHGEQVLRELRRPGATAAIPTLVLTADASPDLPARLREAGADVFLTKPFAIDELLDTVAALACSARD